MCVTSSKAYIDLFYFSDIPVLKCRYTLNFLQQQQARTKYSGIKKYNKIR